MALGAVAQAEEHGNAASEAVSIDRITLVGDDSYPTGGSPDIAAAVADVLKDGANIIDIKAEADGFTCRYDHAADKLLVHQSAGAAAAHAEVGNGTDLSTSTFHLTIWSY